LCHACPLAHPPRRGRLAVPGGERRRRGRAGGEPLLVLLQLHRRPPDVPSQQHVRGQPRRRAAHERLGVRRLLGGGLWRGAGHGVRPRALPRGLHRRDVRVVPRVPIPRRTSRLESRFHDAENYCPYSSDVTVYHDQ
jgi:hypothetical protein